MGLVREREDLQPSHTDIFSYRAPSVTEVAPGGIEAPCKWRFIRCEVCTGVCTA
jgi:hypothetical protein